MRNAVTIPVTVKCRIGIDDQDDDADLERFVTTVTSAGISILIIHARKAWLDGLSPKENRDIPPLNYARVYRLKQAHPELTIVINGGIASLDEAEHHLRHVDGVMLGRAAYHTPWILADIDRRFFGGAVMDRTRADIVLAMEPYIAASMRRGVPLARITRHMLGLFHGEPGGRHWRRVLSEQAFRKDAGFDVVRLALAEVAPRRMKLVAAE
jgi:tRNA-dihydrouridine synthase A